MPSTPAPTRTTPHDPPRSSPSLAWTTAHELWFLERLGLHQMPESSWKDLTEGFPLKRRIDLLIGYQAGHTQRTHWGGINRTLIQEYLDTEFVRIHSTQQAFDFQHYSQDLESTEEEGTGGE